MTLDEEYAYNLKRVKSSSLALHHIPVEQQTKRLCLECIKIDENSFKLMKNQDPEICLAAVSKNGLLLEYVINQTDEICLAAVNYTGFALHFVKQQTPEICLAAVKQNGMAFEYVKSQQPEICLAALENDQYSIRYIKDIPSIAMLIPDELIEKSISGKIMVEHYVKLKEIKNKMSKISDFQSELTEHQETGKRRTKVSL